MVVEMYSEAPKGSADTSQEVMPRCWTAVEQVAGAALVGQVARRLVMYTRRGPNDPQLSPWLAHRNTRKTWMDTP